MNRIDDKNMAAKIVKFVITVRVMIWFAVFFNSLALAGDYDLSWRTIDAGGGMSTGGQYVVMGTTGQPDAAVMSGGSYELLGGFWPGEPLCIVEFHHYARFAEWWLETDCNEGNNWCSGADLNQLGDVNEVDLGLFVDEWLYYCPLDWPLK